MVYEQVSEAISRNGSACPPGTFDNVDFSRLKLIEGEQPKGQMVESNSFQADFLI